MLNPLMVPSGAIGRLGESASHRKHFHPAAIALACLMLALVAGVFSTSAQATKRSIGVPQSSRHDTVPGRQLFRSVPQQGPCVGHVDPRLGNPGIPCWDGGCGQCGFQG
jgi:hypothetical protein